MAPFSFLGEPLKSPVNAEKKSKLWFKKKNTKHSNYPNTVTSPSRPSTSGRSHCFIIPKQVVVLTNPSVNQSKLLQWRTSSLSQQYNTSRTISVLNWEKGKCLLHFGQCMDPLSTALSYSVSGSGEHPIPNGLMTQHFPHHFISLTAEGRTCTYVHPLINYKSSNVWIIKNATLFSHSHHQTSPVGFCWEQGGIPLSCSLQRERRAWIMQRRDT